MKIWSDADNTIGITLFWFIILTTIILQCCLLSMSPWRLIIVSLNYWSLYVPEDPNLSLDETTAEAISVYVIYLLLSFVYYNILLLRSLPIVLHWFVQDQNFITQLKTGDDKECSICYVQFNVSQLQVRFYFNIFEYIIKFYKLSDANAYRL